MRVSDYLMKYSIIFADVGQTPIPLLQGKWSEGVRAW